MQIFFQLSLFVCVLIEKELDIKIRVVDHIKRIVSVANKIGISEKTKREALSIMQDYLFT
jgi:hypothetical protein